MAKYIIIRRIIFEYIKTTKFRFDILIYLMINTERSQGGWRT